jgi:uncharacterized cupin superfamily protein
MSEDRYFISRAEIEQMEGLDKAHFLNTNARRNNKSLGDVVGLTGFGFHIIEVQPEHETTEHHVHYHEDECVYVLSGTATAYIGYDSIEISAGDFIGYRKGGYSHSIKNTGTEPLRCIVVGERSAHDVADYPRRNKRIFRNQDMSWNLVDIDAIETPSAGEK